MILGLSGQMRNGKTLSGVRELLRQAYVNGKTIYSNIHLNFPYIPLTIEMLFDVVEKDKPLKENSIMFIDEIHIWLDSRTATGKKNRIISYFLTQTGKMGLDSDYGLILIYTTQYLDQIDKRLRRLSDMIGECEKIGRLENFGTLFRIEWTKFKGKKSSRSAEFFIGEPYYKFYDTKEVVKYRKTKYDKDFDMPEVE